MCSSGYDWTSFFNTFFAAVVGIAAALLATLLANRHQRKEASKQRQLEHARVLINSAYNMLRMSHRDLDAYRNHASEFEVAIRALAFDLKPADRSFVVELMEWMRRLRADCKKLGVRQPSGDHNTPDIVEVQATNHVFVNYVTDWLASGRSGRREWEAEMNRQRQLLWPDHLDDQRVWP